MKFFKTIILAAFCLSIMPAEADAKVLPYEDSRASYFYVFGPEGQAKYGAEDNKFELIIDVPIAEREDLEIGIFDPDVGGKKDFRENSANLWDTATKFSIYSGSTVLQEGTFRGDIDDEEYFYFGPFEKTKGEKIGEYYRFRLVVEGIEGDDANLFRVKILPDSAEAFSYNVTFRLAPHEGTEMSFYPAVAKGTKYLEVENYDLDVDGGTSVLFNKAEKARWKIKDSKSGQWATTDVDVDEETEGRLLYRIIRATQPYAHAGLRIKNDKGEYIPIYFEKGAAPIVYRPKPVKKKPMPRKDVCNEFTFDATSSYDVDNQDLTFLWNFGDGETSSEPVVSHTYTKGGEYTVNLTVTDSSNLACNTASTSHVVRANTPPNAVFVSPELACTNDVFTFDASKSSDDSSEGLTYLWDFGDGMTAEGVKVNHQYTDGGTYTVRLLVDDNEGSVCSTDSAFRTIRINSQPIANAGSDINLCLDSFSDEYEVRFDGRKSKDRDGDKLSYRWDFGDGTTAAGETVTHTYKKGGSYTATLQVADGVGSKCSVSSDSINVTLNKPPVANAGDAKEVCVGDKVAFDASGSYTEKGEQLSYHWDFGDGATATGKTVSHRFDKGGNYYVRLVVDDGQGTECSTDTDLVAVQVNSNPVAKLSGDNVICIDENASFDASDSYDPDGDTLSYHWDFGDGHSSEGSRRAQHEYKKGGTYTVTVRVNDGQGSACSQDVATTKVKVNTPPVADAGPNLACCVNQEVKFDGSGSSDADGDKLSYRWDFGDGITGEGAKVTHIYKEPGRYHVMLTVNDNSGTDCNSSTSSFYAEVNTKPVPIIKIR